MSTRVERPSGARKGRVAVGLAVLATLAATSGAPALQTTAGSAGQGKAVPARIEQEVCVDCHAVTDFRAGTHGEAVPCLSCHAKDRHAEMPLDPAQSAQTRSALCSSCHVDVASAHPPTSDGAPLCVDCHSAHADPPTIQATSVIAGRCGSCHESEFTRYAKGAHSAAIDPVSPNADVPSCMTCHPSHGTPLSAARREATALCVECHSNTELTLRYELPQMAGKSYADDFHGETMQFLGKGAEGVAPRDVLICSDCHGAHDVAWMDRGDMAAVCLNCHTAADASIAGAWLGHEPVSRSNGVIVWAIRLFYYVFIPLVLGGLLIHILFDIRHHRRMRHSRVHDAAAARIRVTRFSPIERIEHLLSMTSFTLLVATGLPQSYPASPLGNWFIQLWGGIAASRLIHRTAGVFFVTLLVVHVGRAVYGMARYRRLPVMFATKRDFTEVRQSLRHMLGRGEAPSAGKFDFREKFEYWGLFLGGTLMTITGLLLLFPEVASQLLPGAVLAGARVMHGLEATFAVLVVILWHTWAVVLRPEVFPLDKSIFTGKISLERLKDEHGLEYDRIFGTRDPDEIEESGHRSR